MSAEQEERVGQHSYSMLVAAPGDWAFLGILWVWPKGNVKEVLYKKKSPQMRFLYFHQKKLLTSGASIPYRSGLSRMAGGKSWEFSLTNMPFQSHTPAVRKILQMQRDSLPFFPWSASRTRQKKQTIFFWPAAWRRGRPGVLVLGNDQSLELCFPELSSVLQKD